MPLHEMFDENDYATEGIIVKLDSDILQVK